MNEHETPTASIVQANPGAAAAQPPGEQLPAIMESVIMLVLLALAAWTCWLLYWPQIAAMIRFAAAR